MTSAPAPLLRRLLRVWSTLLSGSIAAQLLNLLAFAIAARALPIEMLGGIAMIQGTAKLIDGVVNIRSGVALTTYGARFQAEGDKAGFAGLMKAGLILDAATALVAALITAGVLAAFAGSLGVPGPLAGAAPAYALVVLVSVPGLHLAVLRTFDRYGALAMGEISGAVVRVVLFLAAAALDAGPVWYLAAWLVADILVQVLPLTLALSELRRRAYPPLAHARARAVIARLPGFWRMIWSTHATTSIRALSEQGDVVLTGWLAGSAAAGVLRIAKAAAAPVLQLGTPIQQAAFPALARLKAEGQGTQFLRDGLIYCLCGAGVGLVCVLGAWLAGPSVIEVIAGQGQGTAVPVMLALVIAYAVYLSGIALLPMISALERMGGFLIATLASAAVFLVFAPLAVREWGALGAPLTLIAHNAVWLAVCVLIVVKAGRQMTPSGTPR